MKLIICVDDHMGMAFNHRRVSRDRIVSDRILELGKGNLWITEYSAQLFEGKEEMFHLSSDPFSEAGDGWVFTELTDPLPYEAQLTEVAVFCWNRHYPQDLACSIALAEDGAWMPVKSEEFEGFSHERITLTIYRRR